MIQNFGFPMALSICFIALFIKLLETGMKFIEANVTRDRNESKERENKYIEREDKYIEQNDKWIKEIDKNTESLKEIVNTVKLIGVDLGNKVDDMKDEMSDMGESIQKVLTILDKEDT